MGADRAVREVELLADLTVRQALGRQSGDLELLRRELIEGVSGRGLAPGAIETVDKGVQLSAIRDPDGNTLTFIGDFRVRY
jgi:hypothetical protein